MAPEKEKPPMREKPQERRRSPLREPAAPKRAPPIRKIDFPKKPPGKGDSEEFRGALANLTASEFRHLEKLGAVRPSEAKKGLGDFRAALLANLHSQPSPFWESGAEVVISREQVAKLKEGLRKFKQKKR